MIGYTFRRIIIAAVREAAIYYGATAGERLAKKHIKLSVPKRRTTRRTKRKSKRNG